MLQTSSLLFTFPRLATHRSPAPVLFTPQSNNSSKDNVDFVALHIHTDSLAEVRSLVVKESYRNKGIATELINNVIKEAKELKLQRLLVLTYKKNFFESFGFVEIPKESIPETKIWADCIKCKHFPVCDEVSLELNI